jgi:hypothetical protein
LQLINCHAYNVLFHLRPDRSQVALGRPNVVFEFGGHVLHQNPALHLMSLLAGVANVYSSLEDAALLGIWRGSAGCLAQG